MPAGSLISKKILLPCGKIIKSCPHFLLNKSPTIRDSFDAYFWLKNNGFQSRYGEKDKIPLILFYAVEELANGLSAGEREYYKQQEKSINSSKHNDFSSD